MSFLLCLDIKQQETCLGFSHTITYDVRNVGGMMHVDALSVAHIQQGGIFYVTMEAQHIILNGESQRFHCEEKRRQEKSLE